MIDQNGSEEVMLVGGLYSSDSEFSLAIIF